MGSVEVVYVARPRYIVETGELEAVIPSFVGDNVEEVVWSFHSAYFIYGKAEREADRLSETVKHVRVIDRGKL